MSTKNKLQKKTEKVEDKSTTTVKKNVEKKPSTKQVVEDKKVETKPTTSKKVVEVKKKEKLETTKVVEKKKDSKKTTTTTTTNNKPETTKKVVEEKKVESKPATTKKANKKVVEEKVESKPTTKKQVVEDKKPNNKKITTTTKEQQKQPQQAAKRKFKEVECCSSSEESESDSEEDLGYVPNSSEDEDEDSDFDEIQADFDLVPSVDKDYHSIKNMIVRLVPYNDSSKFNAGELTDLIIEQSTKKKFGRSINIEGSEDPYGFMSILNYELVKKSATIQGYLEYINEKLEQPEDSYLDKKAASGEKSVKSYLAKLINGSKSNQLGLIFSERFINIPNQLVHPIYQFMQFDVELMQEKNNDKNYDFKNYLVFTSFGITAKPNEEDQLPPPKMNTQEDDEDESDDEQPIKKSKSYKGTINKKQEKKHKKEIKKQQEFEEDIEEGTIIYPKCEDKYFKEYATAWSTFDIPYLYGKGSKWTLYSNMIKKGLIMIIPASKYQQFLSDLKEKAIYD